MVLDHVGTLLFPLVELVQPIVKGFLGAGESEDDIDEFSVFGSVDVSMANGELLRDVGQLTNLDYFRGDLAEMLLLLIALEEKGGRDGGENDSEVGEDLAKAANRHGGEQLAES